MSLWTPLIGLVVALLFALGKSVLFLYAYLLWVGTTRLIHALLLLTARPAISGLYPPLIYFGQIYGALVEAYRLLRPGRQRWTAPASTAGAVACRGGQHPQALRLSPISTLWRSAFWSSRRLRHLDAAPVPAVVRRSVMRPQIVHETEVHRQHVRLKIPIQVEIDGIRYQVDDWSVGGLAVESVLTSRKPDERFWVRLIFPFEEFELTMRREARMVYVDQGHGRFGCAFLGLSERHAEVLRYLVDAYLAGELVSAGDLLQARARGNAAPARIQAAYDACCRRGAVAGQPALSRLRVVRARRAGPARRDRFRGLGALFRHRCADRNHRGARGRGPRPDRWPVRLGLGARRAGPRRRLARQGPGFDGATLTLESPCDCRVLDQLGLSGLYYQVGDPLIALIPAQEPLMVRAQLALEQAERLGVGDRAEIHVPGRGEPVLGQIAQIDFTPALQALRSRAEPTSPRLAEVLVRPDLPFDFQDFGGLVSIRFR